jgi:CDP-glycerol glycerophosphotransferase
MRFVYHSFEGRFSDSPRALFEGLIARGEQHDHLWLTDAGHAHGFPDGVATEQFGSEAAIAALEAADVVIANTHTDVQWRKRPGAVYLQTWHGTPLKRIHHDVLWAPEGRLERLSRDVEQWDMLISPNSFSTPLLRQAFRFDGELAETGYPRNDVLNSPHRDELRAQLRERLGIGEGETAVLYAPTWRDDVVFSEPGGKVPLALDADAFLGALGDGHHLLLRLHPLMSGHLSPIAHPAVHELSDHPDVRDLYLAADVLVTDYSSVMFDFAVTGKPMVFYTYDLADYRDRLRGFYFDFGPEAPGPLVETTAEVAAAVADLDGLAERCAERYATFRARFCHLEDGRATERVLRLLDDATS